MAFLIWRLEDGPKLCCIGPQMQRLRSSTDLCKDLRLIYGPTDSLFTENTGEYGGKRPRILRADSSTTTSA